MHDACNFDPAARYVAEQLSSGDSAAASDSLARFVFHIAHEQHVTAPTRALADRLRADEIIDLTRDISCMTAARQLER